MKHLFRRNKYGVSAKDKRTRQTPWGQKTFDSKKEAERFDELAYLAASGKVLTFMMQVPFYLPGPTRYVCDFLVFWSNGDVSFEDVKGMRTPEYRAKKKQVEDLYKPITITEL